jgi:hypothetical protein
MKVIINRNYESNQTYGTMVVMDTGRLLFTCNTLELKNMGNIKRLSCIPEGTYQCEKIIRPDGRNGIHVKDVPNRSAILIHSGNYAAGLSVDIEGCILVGSDFKDINNDGHLDIINSDRTFNKLFNTLSAKFELIITS